MTITFIKFIFNVYIIKIHSIDVFQPIRNFLYSYYGTYGTKNYIQIML